MSDERGRRERALTMTKQLERWVAESATLLFAVPNLRGSLVIEFDTTSGALRPILRSDGVLSGASPPGTH